MGFLLGGSAASNQQPNYTSIQVQTAVNTLPIPIVIGTGKLAPNVIDAVNFQSHDANNGKGGKSGAKDYSASVELALCAGVADAVPIVFVNGTQLKTLSQLGMTLLTGTYPDQAPWSYLGDNHFTGDAPYGYPGTAILVRANYDLGESASVPNHNVLVVRKTGLQATWCNPSTINATAYPPLATAFPSGIPTADMALAIQDCLTNEQYGILGFPSSAINLGTLLSSGAAGTTGDSAAQTYWRALGFGFCFVLDSVETFQSSLTRWLQLGNCAAVWSGTALKFIPYGDTEVDGNGVKYVPNLTPVYALDDDAYVGDSSADPVEVQRTDPSDAYNVVRVEITKDDGWFSYLPVEARDQDAIERSGANRIMPAVTGHEILGQTNGLIVANLLLRQQLLWRNTVTIKLSWEFCLLEPMDWVTLSDPALEYLNQLCRVLSVEEDEQGELTVTLQEYIPGSSTANGNYFGQGMGHGIPDTGQTAPNVNSPIVFQPSTSLASPLAVWIALSGGGSGTFDPNWGGADVWLSSDNTNYRNVGTIEMPARTGALTGTLAAYSGANPDNTHTLSVDLTESHGTLETVSAGDAANAATLCYVDGELLSFQTATLVSQTATHEAHTVPSAGPYQVNPTNQATWVSDGGVIYAIGGLPLIEVGGAPGIGQYNVDAFGLYTFNAADAGVGVQITYTWNNPYHYALTGLYRGLYGTSAGSHSSTTRFARLDDAVFKFPLPDWAVGQTLYAKFVSFNVFGLGTQDISLLSPSTFAAPGIAAPTGLTAYAVALSVNIPTIAPAVNIGLYAQVNAPPDKNLVVQFTYGTLISSQFYDFSPPFGQWSSSTSLLVSGGQTLAVRARFITKDLAQASPWVQTTTYVPLGSELWTTDDVNNIPIVTDDVTGALIGVHD